MRSINPITSRKRVFAFMVKVAELHRIRDAITRMMEEREMQALFADYLLVKCITGEALMEQI